jgi:GTPase SAR1 family protein
MIVFRSLLKVYYRGVSVALLIYDVTDRHTFESMKNYWYPTLSKQMINLGEYIKGDIITIMIGNKIDLK